MWKNVIRAALAFALLAIGACEQKDPSGTSVNRPPGQEATSGGSSSSVGSLADVPGGSGTGGSGDAGMGKPRADAGTMMR
jgi:hypothetical protein